MPSKSICGMSKAELSHAYIMTPNFPNHISAGTTCECTLTSNYENGQILLRRVDMKVFISFNNQFLYSIQKIFKLYIITKASE